MEFSTQLLNEELYTKTVNRCVANEITFGDPVTLLRYLRKNWHNNSVYDRANIRDTFKKLTLEECKNMDDFIEKFEEQRALMEKYKIGLLTDDEDALHQFHEKLPVAHKSYEAHAMANSTKFSDATAYYKNLAKRFSDLPGSTHPSFKNRLILLTSR